MNLDLKFSVSALYPALLLVLTIFFTAFIYRRTVPAVIPLYRRLLAGLRGFALAAAALLLFEPILDLALQRSHKPTVAVLIDRSASMSLADSAGQRAEQVRAALALPWVQLLREKTDLVFFAFSDTLQTLTADSLPHLAYNGDGSNLAEALRAVQERLAAREYRAAILLSDGAYNLGENPVRVAETYATPIFTARLDAGRQTRDALISDVLTNEVAYAETQLPVEITVAASGYQGRKSMLRVFEGEQEIAATAVLLPADNTQTTAKITLTPRQLGLNRYLVKLDALEGEQTLANNRRAFYVRVLKSKLHIWIFAGDPSADYSFLKRALQRDPNYQVRGFAQRPGGSFYSDGENLPAFGNTSSWKEVDVLIFVDFPRRDSDRALLEMMRTQLTASGKPLLYLHGPQADMASLWQLRAALPLANPPALTNEHSVVVHVETGGLTHAVTRPLVEAKVASEDLPPLFSNVLSLKTLPGSEVLLSSTPATARQNATPLCLAQKNAARKTLTLWAYDLWRWHLMLQATPQRAAIYEQLLEGLVRWLVTKEDAKLVRLTTSKEVYRGGEQIELLGQVYREDYVPLEGAHVQVRLSGPQWQQEVLLQDAGSGLYRARLQVLGGGEYQFSGSAELAGKKLGEDAGKFSVEPFSLEFLQTRVNEPLLRQLAETSGGAFVPPDSLAQALAQISLAPVLQHEAREYALAGKWPVLLVLLLTLALEWFLRKREGML